MIDETWLGIFLFLSMVYVRSTETASCPQSRETVTRVPSCPKSKEEWNLRANIKQCSLVRKQCINDGESVFHCVINSFVNETLEVCAPKVRIIGRSCVEYNVRGAIIQESPYIKCSNSCPFSYTSTDAYKYQDCFKINTSKQRTDNLSMSTTTASENSNFHSNISRYAQEDCTYLVSSSWQIVAVLMIAINAILFILIVYLIVRIKGKKSTMSKYELIEHHRKEEENETIERKEDSTSDRDKKNYGNNTSMQGKYVAAIDIGDTYLTMAISYPRSPEDVKLLGSLDRMCILINPKGAATHFGEKAIKEYNREAKTNEKHHDLCIFKLSEIGMKDKYYKEALRSIIERAECELLNILPEHSDIYYVFVVPNYWGEDARKKLINELSEIDKIPTDKCRVIKRKDTLSPFIHEVNARVVCLNFNVDNLVLRPESESATYAILHVGSTHYDLIFTRVERDHSDRNSPVPEPKQWQGNLPKDRFLEFFERIYGRKAINGKKDNFNWEYVSFLLDFENLVKNTDESSTDDDTVNFKLSKGLMDINNDERLRKKIEKKIEELEGIILGENNWTFKIKLKWLKGFFNGIRDDINDMLKNSWTHFETRNVKCVVMTGAYSKRKIIWDIAEKFWFKDKKVTVVVPEDTHVFAMGGAYYGQKLKWPKNK